MPVTSVTAPSAPPASATTPPAAALPPASSGFAAALTTATARFDPARLPTVSLGTMVSALAGADPAGVADAYASATVAAPAGVGAAGNAGAVDGSPAARGAGGMAASRILAAGERYLGVPYKWGGTNPDVGLDCSGFVQRVFADLGVRLPRVSVDQAKAGKAVAGLSEARPGDLVFWYGNGRRPNHIGIYAGDNKMLVAPRTGDVVRYQEMNRTPDVIRRVA
ncbi:C40 family peptidase [Egicoccus sp. AB-alg2]|uniref:C40 family peptidase n=1 Tax=Egicoccus sp. AB-alg2 TaxID=3242693 RepID=UPI00359E8CA3